MVYFIASCMFVCVPLCRSVHMRTGGYGGQKVFQVPWAPLWIVQLNSSPLQKKWVFSFAHSSLQDTCSFNIQNVILLFPCRKERFAKFHFVNVRTESYSVTKSEIIIADYVIHTDWHLSLLKKIISISTSSL